MNFLKKIPKLEQISPVYAVIVVMIYTWSLILFFWRFPSWLYFSTLGEVAVIFSYMVTVNLLESLMVIFTLVVMAVILPQKWFHEQFVTKGSLLVLLGLGYLMISYGSLINGVLSPWQLLQKVMLVGLLILGITFVVDRVGFLNRFIFEFSNRMTIFLYIWVPISVLALLTVLIRNIF